MKIIDITRLLSDKTVSYPGDMPPQFSQRDAGLYLISDLVMNSHSGTHIDAPVHYLKTGDTIDAIPLDHVIGPCRVIDVSSAGSEITSADLSGRLGTSKRILLKTKFLSRTPVPGRLPAPHNGCSGTAQRKRRPLCRDRLVLNRSI